MKIALANSRLSKHWKNMDMPIDSFILKLEELLRTTKKQFTMAEYRNKSKSERDKAKDGMGFICGHLKVNNGPRKIDNISFRTASSLDADYAKHDTLDKIKEVLNGVEYLVYSTLSHTEENPRLRVIVFYNREATLDECQAVSRKIAERIGIEIFDDTTFQANRLMYAPTCCVDADPIFIHNRGRLLNVDDILAAYDDWQDMSSWPISQRVTKSIRKDVIAHQENPLEKQGIVGAFCKTYSISGSISEYLDDVYVPCDMEDRYTFIGGSTSAGLIVYDDMFAYSHHGTDPANNGHIHNAYDLVRIHKFGDLDKGCDDDKESNKAMREFVLQDKKVQGVLIREEFENAGKEFTEEDESIVKDWLETTISNGNVIHKIKETEFVNMIQSKHDYFYVNGDMYDKQGLIDQGAIKKGIQDKIEIFIKHGQAKKVDDLFKALCIKAFHEPHIPKPDEIHFRNLSLKITNDGFKEIEYPKFVITRLKHDFDDNAKSINKWLSFLNCLFDKEDIKTIQEYIGYCFVPTTKAQKALFIKGGGGEGKSVLTSMIYNMFENVCIKDKIQNITKSQFKLATLENKLVFLDDDLNTEGLSETGLWKEVVTSMGKMTIEKKGKDSREANVFAKYFCVGNSDITSLFDHSDAFYDRLMPITTKGNKFRGTSSENVNLSSELENELPGIINWALEGLLRLHRNGYKFTISAKTLENIHGIRLMNDSVLAFIESDYLEFGESFEAYISDIEKAYIKWCEDNAEIPARNFTRRFKEMVLSVRKFKCLYCNSIRLRGKHSRGYKGLKVADSVLGQIILLFDDVI